MNTTTTGPEQISKHCYHCGDPCGTPILANDKSFCCQGCKQVYQLLNDHNLCGYYDLDTTPGIKVKGKFTSGRFAYLDDDPLSKKLLQFSSDTQSNITFSLPQMHCSSCVYLLENLHRIDPGIITCSVNFQRKEIFISYDPALVSLRTIVELLAFIGYEPTISLKDVTQDNQQEVEKSNRWLQRSKLLRIGVAGFCFANIMMLSFPEYLSSGQIEHTLREGFAWLNMVLSLPVLFFCAPVFFISAYKGFRQRFINIDAPIALAILLTFARSYYEIVSGTGVGYLDSGTGIVFFMLVGRWFQDKTYDSLAFDRDYRSYLPLGAIIVETSGEFPNQVRTEKNIPLTDLKKDDHIIIRNAEMIPADSVLLKGETQVDYSFVNGENTPVTRKKGELIYAGGKQMGGAIELRIVKPVSQSYITQLWNNTVFDKPKHIKQSFINRWSRYFTLVLFSIALATVIFWWISNPQNILPALTAVLIVACPCSLLLSHTFTNGNMLRIFGRNKLYLKNAQVIEALGTVDHIVFDKTGTITRINQSAVKYNGVALSEKEKEIIRTISQQSSHPLSKLIAVEMNHEYSDGKQADIRYFKEYSGHGISAMVNNTAVRIGTESFVNKSDTKPTSTHVGTEVHVQVGKELKGFFSISNQYRGGVRKAIQALQVAGYKLHVLSGDNDAEKETLQYIFGDDAIIRFRQLPLDKLEYIKELQQNNANVLMIGDGLNDAGALMQADAGIAVNSNNAQFTPACDAILDGDHIKDISTLLRYAKAGKKIVTASFILSILYNVAGLSFAVSASLSPLVAAILMPASSISIVLFVTMTGNKVAHRYGLL